MKIAIVAPVMVPVPLPTYGGIERIVDELARGLAARGHLVTVFCAGGSTIAGEGITRVEGSPYPTGNHLEENRSWELKLFQAVLDRQHEFDVIHFHFEPIAFRLDDGSNMLDAFEAPVVCTFHNITTIPEHQAYYRSATSLYRHTVTFVSENQRSHIPFFPRSRVVYNAIPVDAFPYEERKEPFLFCLGRITPTKGILEAIAVAKKTGVPLVIAAKVDPVDRNFYETEVRPLIDDDLIRYVGEADFNRKTDYLKRARALLFPVLWEEPFGLVMVEALACGTPVIAFRRGSVPEIVTDGMNGFVVDTVPEMAEAVGKLETISPRACRASVEERFSISRMTDEYERLFKEIASIARHC